MKPSLTLEYRLLETAVCSYLWHCQSLSFRLAKLSCSRLALKLQRLHEPMPFLAIIIVALYVTVNYWNKDNKNSLISIASNHDRYVHEDKSLVSAFVGKPSLGETSLAWPFSELAP